MMCILCNARAYYCNQASSATAARELADAAVQDGARGLGQLSGLGSAGRWRANVERDMHRHSMKALGMNVKLYGVRTVKHRKAGLAAEAAVHDILLPHEMMAHLWRADKEQFKRIMGTDALPEWWAKVKASGEHWYAQHPARAEVESEGGARHIPGRLFGDDGHVGLRKIGLLHWSSCVASMMTRKTRFPIAVVSGDTSLGPPTENPILEAVVWSWKVAATGVFPTRDHLGAPMTGWRKRMAGQQIAGGFKLLFCQMLGDWQWLAKVLSLETKWDTESMCHLCHATKSGCTNYANFCHDAPHIETTRSAAHYLESPAAQKSPLSKLPGWHLETCMVDIMHAGPLGIVAWAAGAQ